MNDDERTKLKCAIALLQDLLIEPKAAPTLIYAAMKNSIFYGVDVRKLPVNKFSEQWKLNVGRGTNVHLDFGSGKWNGEAVGIPITPMGSDVLGNAVAFDYAEESDSGFYCVGTIEGGLDKHSICVTPDMRLHEICGYENGKALSGAKFDLTRSNQMRPAGWTSADAAGLPIAPLLVRYDEIESGVINHPLRMTVPQTRGNVWPASHCTMGNLWDVVEFNPPLGAWFRLKADFDITPFSKTNQIILTALKEKGAIVADDGGAWYVCGRPDPRWDDNDLGKLGDALRGSAFEAVDASCVMIAKDSYEAKQI